MELKPCPFCGNTDIRSSLKTGGEKYTQTEKLHIYYATVFCNNCHAYGPRVKVLYPDVRYNSRTTVERDEEIKRLAAESWNNRK